MPFHFKEFIYAISYVIVTAFGSLAGDSCGATMRLEVESFFVLNDTAVGEQNFPVRSPLLGIHVPPPKRYSNSCAAMGR